MQKRSFLKSMSSCITAARSNTIALSFIFNRRWTEDSRSNYIPTHSEIVNGGSPSFDDEQDLQFEEANERFEQKYNFRFEDPYVVICHELCSVQRAFRSGTSIVTHSRAMPSSVRRVDDSRRLARLERERLKTLKIQKLLEKLEQVKAVSGNQGARARLLCRKRLD